MAEALEIKLPQSFFDALEEIKESSEERNDNRSDSDFYAKNILMVEIFKKLLQLLQVN